MKYFIIGDLHSCDLDFFINKTNLSMNKGCFICTGDFDSMKTIEQFITLEKKLKNHNKEVLVVPGNHDHAIYNNIGITSGELRKKKQTTQTLRDEWSQNINGVKYIKKLLGIGNNNGNTTFKKRFSLDAKKYEDIYSGVIMHGGYYGKKVKSRFTSEEQFLWNRIDSTEILNENFNEMRDKGHNIMIRGHDHSPSYVERDLFNGDIIGETYIDKVIGKIRRITELKTDKRYIITHGALSKGFFASIDTNDSQTNNPVLYFHNMNYF